jgi:hypothetical protein
LIPSTAVYSIHDIYIYITGVGDTQMTGESAPSRDAGVPDLERNEVRAEEPERNPEVGIGTERTSHWQLPPSAITPGHHR